MDTLDIRRASERFHTRLDWLDSHHCFSFGHHRDPGNVGHGLLVVFNDDVVAPGGGFGTHPHNDMEIVTWVLDGALEHRDSEGNVGVIRPGLAQRMSAGTGITHSEVNHSSTQPVHFLQMWVVPDRIGIDPGYEQRDVSALLASGELVPVASGQGHDGAIGIRQAGAVMSVARLDAGSRVRLPEEPFVHLYVAAGTVRLDTSAPSSDTDRLDLDTGDAVRMTDATGVGVVASASSEIVVWTSDRSA